MPAPKTIQEAQAYISRLSHLVAAGKLDVDAGLAIKDLLQSYIDSVIGSEVDQRLRALEEMAREQATRGGGTTVIVESSMPRLPGAQVLMPGDPPVIDQRSNPWGNVPDVGSAVDVSPEKQGRPRKHPKLGPGFQPPADDNGDPEPS